MERTADTTGAQTQTLCSTLRLCPTAMEVIAQTLRSWHEMGIVAATSSILSTHHLVVSTLALQDQSTPTIQHRPASSTRLTAPFKEYALFQALPMLTAVLVPSTLAVMDRFPRQMAESDAPRIRREHQDDLRALMVSLDQRMTTIEKLQEEALDEIWAMHSSLITFMKDSHQSSRLVSSEITAWTQRQERVNLLLAQITGLQNRCRDLEVQKKLVRVKVEHASSESPVHAARLAVLDESLKEDEATLQGLQTEYKQLIAHKINLPPPIDSTGLGLAKVTRSGGSTAAPSPAKRPRPS